MGERIFWNAAQHESKVEQFYGRGVENYGDYHGGYLNFGLWENGNSDYVTAAQTLVLHMGNLMKLDRQSKMLDVACGMGAQCVFMHQQYGCCIDALDVTWKHIERTKERIEKHQLRKNVRIHHGTASQLPFGNEEFTHVMSIEGPQHFNTREKFVQEAYRVLQAGGIICVTDYVLKRKPTTVFDKFIVELGARLWHVPKANYEIIDSYKRMLERNGFRNVVLEERGKDVIPGYFFEQHRRETRRAIRKIRGWVAAYPGHLIDYAVYWGFTSGLVEYVFVLGEK